MKKLFLAMLGAVAVSLSLSNALAENAAAGQAADSGQQSDAAAQDKAAARSNRAEEKKELRRETEARSRETHQHAIGAAKVQHNAVRRENARRALQTK